jgi:uncharacterized protein (TIGR03067 family)
MTAPPGRSRRRLAVLGTVVVLVAAAGFAAWYFLIRTPEPRTDLGRLQGDWQIAVGDRVTPNVVTVAGDTWRVTANGVAAKPYRVTLNEAADPKEIDLELADTAGLTGAPVRMRGVYRFDDPRTLRVRFGVGAEARPAALDDPDAVVQVLTRVKVEPAPGK